MKGKGRTYVLDTSVLINDPEVFYKLGDSDIVIPSAVIKEIDGINRNPDPEEPRAKAARKVSRTLDGLGSSQDISVGARTSVGSTVRIFNRYAAVDDLASNADKRIVGTAIMLKEESGTRVTLVSTDSLCGAPHKLSYAESIVMRRGEGWKVTSMQLFQRRRLFFKSRCSA